MPNKNPITVVGILASLMLVAGAAMLYLTPAPPLVQEQAPLTRHASPFKAPPAVSPTPAPVTPEPAPQALPVSATVRALSTPELTADDLAKLTPTERDRYHKMRETLQQLLQQVQTLEQENTDLQHALQQGDTKNQALDAEINKLRPTPTPPPTPTPVP